MSSLKPLGNRVLIEPNQEAEKTAGGIIIPDTAKEKPSKGVVIAVGDGVRNANGDLISMSVKKGDQVLYGKYSGTEVKLDGKIFMIMPETDVLGIIA